MFYKTKRDVDKTTLSILNVIIEHLESPDLYAIIPFIDCSSAFNTFRLYLLIRKVMDSQVGKQFATYVYSFLTNTVHRM